MSNKHTPGPWRYHLGRGSRPRFHIQTAGGYQIASTTELTTPKTAKRAVDFDENATREANARLIAASPELLAALEYALEHVEANSDDDDALNVIEQARAAIQKATKP
jgi:hypothetical protein